MEGPTPFQPPWNNEGNALVTLSLYHPTLEELKAGLASGKYTARTMVFADGMSGWTPAGEIADDEDSRDVAHAVVVEVGVAPVIDSDIEFGEFPSPAAYDFNNDGKTDIVVGNKSGEIKVFLAPDWEEVEGGLGLPPIGTFSSPTFGDLTGDGVPDYFISDDGSNMPGDLPDETTIYITSEDNVPIFLEYGKAGYIMFKLEQGDIGSFVEPKYYYRPIPTSELLLNPELGQLFGWD